MKQNDVSSFLTLKSFTLAIMEVWLRLAMGRGGAEMGIPAPCPIGIFSASNPPYFSIMGRRGGVGIPNPFFFFLTQRSERSEDAITAISRFLQFGQPTVREGY